MWLYVHAPHLFLQTWHPDQYAVQPLLLLEGKSGCVIDANPKALEAGIHNGMNVATASSLASDGEFIQFNELAMAEAKNRLAKKLLAYTSWLGGDGDVGMYLEIATMKKLLGDGPSIAKKIQQTLKHFTLNMSSAPYAKTARLLAKSQLEVHIEKENIKSYLNNLAISDLVFPPNTEHAIRKLGIKKLEKLLQLKRSDVAYRIDQQLALELDHLVGHKTWLPKPFKVPLHFYLPHELACEAEHAQQLRFPLKYLLNEFCQFMLKNNVSAQRVQVACYDREHKCYPISIELARASTTLDQWLDMLRFTLEQFKPSQAICRLLMVCKVFEAQQAQPTDMFQTPAKEESVNTLLNKLSSRLGKQAYGFLNPVHHGLPEYQTQLDETPQGGTKIQSHYQDQPLWLLPQPKQVSLNGYDIVHGPERKQGFWWQGHTGFRDYYIARGHQGALHWLFRDEQNAWWLHGYFA